MSHQTERSVHRPNNSECTLQWGAALSYFQQEEHHGLIAKPSLIVLLIPLWISAWRRSLTHISSVCLSPPGSYCGDGVSGCQLPRLGCCCPVSHCCFLSHGDQSKCLHPPHGLLDTVTFDFVHPRCFKAAWLMFLFVLYVFLLCFRAD